MPDNKQTPLDAVVGRFDGTSLESPAIESVAQLGKLATDPVVLDITCEQLADAGLPKSVPVIWNRSTQTLQSVKPLLDEYRTAPVRRIGIAQTDTLQSFIDLVNRHKDDGSALFGRAQWPKPSLTAVIDYDAADREPRFGTHRIEYLFPVTDELTTWVGMNGKAMDQVDFAAFIEEHAAELSAPMDGERSTYEPLFRETFATPSDLIQLSRHLEVFVAARAKQGIRLQTGERTVEFMEEHQNADGEKIVVPGIFIVSVQAWKDGDAVRIPARLRYRVVGGAVKWFYQLYRWEYFLREQVQNDLKQAAAETELPAFEGKSEK